MFLSPYTHDSLYIIIKLELLVQVNLFSLRSEQISLDALSLTGQLERSFVPIKLSQAKSKDLHRASKIAFLKL